MKHVFNNLSEESLPFLLLEDRAERFSISKLVGISLLKTVSQNLLMTNGRFSTISGDFCQLFCTTV